MQTFIASHSQCTPPTWRINQQFIWLCNVFVCFFFRFCSFIMCWCLSFEVQVLETLFSTMTINVTSKYDAKLLIWPTSHQITRRIVLIPATSDFYVKIETFIYSSIDISNVLDGIEIRHPLLFNCRPFCSFHNFYFRYIYYF